MPGKVEGHPLIICLLYIDTPVLFLLYYGEGSQFPGPQFRDSSKQTQIKLLTLAGCNTTAATLA